MEMVYNEKRKYGLSIGTYQIVNIPSSHPLAILNEGKSNLIK